MSASARQAAIGACVFLFLGLCEGNERFTLVSYVPEPGTELVMFSIEPTPQGKIRNQFIPQHYFQAATKARDKNGGKVLVCVGGGGRSAGFSQMASSSKLRLRFVDELIKFCKEHNLDGVDYDWEAPSNQAEAKNYGILLSNTKKLFRAHKLMVTVAIHVWQDLGKVGFNAVDRVHLMAYDAHKQLDATGRHSTLEAAMKFVMHVSSFGVPKDQQNHDLIKKLVLGMPAYGRNRDNMAEVATYSEIMRDHNPGPEVDELPSGMYFNGVKTVEKKTRWAEGNGLAGVMLWELGQDTTDAKTSLLHAARRVQADLSGIGNSTSTPARSSTTGMGEL